MFSTHGTINGAELPLVKMRLSRPAGRFPILPLNGTRKKRTLHLCFSSRPHGILDDAQEGIAVAGGLLFAHAADIQQFIGAQRAFSPPFPAGWHR